MGIDILQRLNVMEIVGLRREFYGGRDRHRLWYAYIYIKLLKKSFAIQV